MKFFTYSLSFLCQLFLILSGSSVDSKNLVTDSPNLTLKVQALSKSIAEGLTKLGKEQLDPMVIDDLHFNNDGFKLDLVNRTVHGLNSLVIDNVSVNACPKVVSILFHTNFIMKNVYKIDGNLLSTPINGEGDYTVNLDDVRIDLVIPFDIMKDTLGKDVIYLKRYQYTYDVRSGAQFKFVNLYNGDKALSDKMHATINQNWNVLTTRYGKYLLDQVNDKIFDAIRCYVYSIPLDTIV